MRIGVDIRPLAASPYGGVPEYIRGLLPQLFAQGREHEFILFQNSYKKTSIPAEWLAHKNVSARTFRYPNKFFSVTTRYAGLPKCDVLLGGVDVFFSPHFFPLPLSSRARRVTTFHDISFDLFGEFFDAKRRAWHAFVNPKAQAKASERIIAVSDATKRDIVRRYGIEDGKIDVVHSGIAPQQPPSPGRWDELQRSFGIPDTYILSVSTIEPRKNLETLIRGFEALAGDPALANVHLVLAGPFGWSYKRIVRSAAHSPAARRIHVVGPIPDELKGQLYARARLFVYPSFYEGFGFPPLEAMQAGVPVLASMASSVPEVVGSAALLIDPYRVSELGLAMKEVLRDAALREQLIAEGFERSTLFSWERSAAQTLAVFEKARH